MLNQLMNTLWNLFKGQAPAPKQRSSQTKYDKLRMTEALSWAVNEPELLIDVVAKLLLPLFEPKDFRDMLYDLLTDASESLVVRLARCTGDFTVTTKKNMLRNYQKNLGRHIENVEMFHGVFRQMISDCVTGTIWSGHHSGQLSLDHWIANVLKTYFADNDKLLLDVLKKLQKFQPLPLYEQPPKYIGGRRVKRLRKRTTNPRSKKKSTLRKRKRSTRH
jgi:hypothetical protein